jgi:hypothetical protein
MAVTGKNDWSAEPQPGGRGPAPGELALVQSFLNTRWDVGLDHGEVFVSADALAGWLSDRGLLADDRRLTDEDVARCLAVREGLRAMAFVNGGHPPDEGAIDAMRRASQAASLQLRIEPDGPEFLVDLDAGLDGAIGAVYGVVARAMANGSWQRLKACPGRHCGWVFYDQSRNQSARWCSTRVCGAREKARAYYRRKTGAPSRARG